MKCGSYRNSAWSCTEAGVKIVQKCRRFPFTFPLPVFIGWIQTWAVFSPTNKVRYEGKWRILFTSEETMLNQLSSGFFSPQEVPWLKKENKKLLSPSNLEAKIFTRSMGQILKGFMIRFCCTGTPDTGGISTHALQRKSLWQLFPLPCGGKGEEAGILGPKSVALNSTQKHRSQWRSREQWAVSSSPQPTASSSPAAGQLHGLEAPKLLGPRIPFPQACGASDNWLFQTGSTRFLRIWLWTNYKAIFSKTETFDFIEKTRCNVAFFSPPLCRIFVF